VTIFSTTKSHALSTEPQPSQSSLLQLSLRSAVHQNSLPFASGATTADVLCPWPTAHKFEQQSVSNGTQDRKAKYPNHDKVTFPVDCRSRYTVSRPTGVQGIRGQDTTQVTQTTNECRSCGNTHFSVTWLEYLVRPRHCNRHSRAQAESNKQEPAITRPGV
jgi:hypothetical protein